MTTTTKRWTHERAKLGYLCRFSPHDVQAIADARRELRAARAEDYICTLVDGAPPLTTDQRYRLAGLLLASA